MVCVCVCVICTLYGTVWRARSNLLQMNAVNRCVCKQPTRHEHTHLFQLNSTPWYHTPDDTPPWTAYFFGKYCGDCNVAATVPSCQVRPEMGRWLWIVGWNIASPADMGACPDSMHGITCNNVLVWLPSPPPTSDTYIYICILYMYIIYVYYIYI